MGLALDMDLHILQVPQSNHTHLAQTGELALQKRHSDLFDMEIAEAVQFVLEVGVVRIAILAEDYLLLST